MPHEHKSDYPIMTDAADLPSAPGTLPCAGVARPRLEPAPYPIDELPSGDDSYRPVPLTHVGTVPARIVTIGRLIPPRIE
jgi:hypothetical protein